MQNRRPWHAPRPLMLSLGLAATCLAFGTGCGPTDEPAQPEEDMGGGESGCISTLDCGAEQVCDTARGVCVDRPAEEDMGDQRVGGDMGDQMTGDMGGQMTGDMGGGDMGGGDMGGQMTGDDMGDDMGGQMATLPAEFNGLCVMRIDEGADGSVERIEGRSYDAEDRVTRLVVDATAAGMVSRTESWQYDANGNLTSYELDEDGDGMADFTYQATYDSEDRLLTFEQDGVIDEVSGRVNLKADGVFETRGENRYQMGTGEPLEIKRDGDGDATDWGYTVTYTRLGTGEPLTLEVNGRLQPSGTPEPALAGGAPEFKQEWSRDGQGNILGMKVDVGTSMTDPATGRASFTLPTDNVWDYRVEYIYDVDGNLTREDYYGWVSGGQVVFVAGPTPLVTISHSYDANGIDTSEFRVQGQAQQRTEITYDANKNPTLRRFDFNLDGTFDRVLTTTYTVDDELLLYEVDGSFDTSSQTPPPAVAPDGVADFSYKVSYDAEGRPLSRSVDGVLGAGGSIQTPADGVLDYNETRTYDAEGRPLTWEQDGELVPETTWDIKTPADGTFDFKLTVVRDAEGRATSYEQYGERNEDGTIAKFSKGTMPHFVQRTVYDANGEVTKIERDGALNQDGTLRQEANGTFQTTTYTYDANGNVTLQEIDVESDGTVDLTVTRDYDANGDLIKVSVDGVIGDMGNLTSRADGSPDELRDVTTDCR